MRCWSSKSRRRRISPRRTVSSNSNAAPMTTPSSYSFAQKCHKIKKQNRESNKMADAKPQITWDHIHLRTPDPEATAQWFVEMLGGEIIRTPVRLDVRLGGASIFLAAVTDGDG